MKLYSVQKLKIFTAISTLAKYQLLKHYPKKRLYKTLLFNDHINEKFGKAMKGVGFLNKLHCFLPCSSLLVIYKSFIKPHLYYGDVIYDQHSNAEKLSPFNIMQQ